MESTLVAPRAGFHSHVLAMRTSYSRQFIDITDEVRTCIEQSSFSSGLAVIASRHTTAAIVINEHEPELLKDLDRMLVELAPPDGHYAHNGVPCGKGEQPNGHSHCQALLLSASASVPIAAGEPVLGRYQRVFLVELDGPRYREVTVALLGT